MRTSLKSSLRQVLPAPGYLVLIFVALVSMELTWLFINYMAGFGGPADKVLTIRDDSILVLLSLYAVHRVFAFHPLTNTEYCDWLKITPWRRGLPLPLGPVYPRPIDALVVLVLAGLLADPRVPWDSESHRPSMLVGILTAVLCHAVAVSTVTCLLEPKMPAYLALFLLGLSLQMSGWAPIASFLVLAVGWAVALYGLSQSWELFPWKDTVHWGTRVKRKWTSMQTQSGGISNDQPSLDRVAPSELGWPFNALSPWTPPPQSPIKGRLLTTGLIGWWMHAFLFNITNTEIVNGIGALLLGYGGIAIVISKIVSYGGNHASPLSVAGRLRLFQWIVPGYDRIFAGSIVLTIIIPLFGLGGHWLKIPGHALIPLVAVAAMWCYNLIGPDPTDWKLTSPARITHGKLPANNYQQLT